MNPSLRTALSSARTPAMPTRPDFGAIRNARSMPTASMRSIICSSSRPAISALLAFILPAKNSSFQPGRCDSASRFQMLTTASMAWVRFGDDTIVLPIDERRMNLATLLASHAAGRPDHPAWLEHGRIVTHAQLHREVGALASRLHALGVARGARVGLCLPDTAAHLMLHYALAWVGATIVPLDHRWTLDEAARVARAMRCDLVIDADARFETLHDGRSVTFDAGWTAGDAPPPPIVEASDLPLILSLSSGTTGRPTGAIVTHEQLYERFISQWVTMTFNMHDRYLLATPLYFGGGRSFAMSFLAAGGTVVFAPPPHDSAELIAIARDTRATIGFLVPTQVRRLLGDWQGEGPAFPGLRLLVTSGSAVRAEERARIAERMCPACLDYYASSEGGGIAVLQPDEQLVHPQSVGRPTFRVETRVIGPANEALPDGVVGRLQYRGPGVSRTLVDEHGELVDLSASDGWFEPGDLASRLPSGHLVLAGRAKDVIIRAGINLYPAE